MAVAIDGNVWITSSDGVILKLNAVDGSVISSVRLTRAALFVGQSHSVPSTSSSQETAAVRDVVIGSGQEPMSDAVNVINDVELASKSSQVTNGAGIDSLPIIAKQNGHASAGFENKSNGDFSTADQVQPNLTCIASKGSTVAQSSLSAQEFHKEVQNPRRDGGHPVGLENKNSKEAAAGRDHLDIQAIAVNADDNVVVSVVSDKKVYVFTPYGKLVFSYPSSGEVCEDVIGDCRKVLRNGECGGVGGGDGEDCENGSIFKNGVKQKGVARMNNKNNRVMITGKDVKNSVMYDMETVEGSRDNGAAPAGDNGSPRLYGAGGDGICISCVGADVGRTANTEVTGVAAACFDKRLVSEMKCPSALCCDAFNNILVADFTSDCVHLVSPAGRFLGRLLTKDDGISCPTFLSLDVDRGRLYVGQYGGEVLVFRYLSCIKHA